MNDELQNHYAPLDLKLLSPAFTFELLVILLILGIYAVWNGWFELCLVGLCFELIVLCFLSLWSFKFLVKYRFMLW